MQNTHLNISIDKKEVSCVVNRSTHLSENTCFILGHGASGDLNSGNLPAISASLAEAGFPVLRYNASGQLKSRIKTLEGVLDSKHAELKDVKKWILAGHSMGGRTACAVARKREDVAAVVLFSFPLHPPGKPDQLRDEDLTALQVPVFFVKGTKDTFSTEAPWKEVLSRMQSPRVEVAIVEKGDHSLSTKSGIGKQRYEEWISKVVDFSSSLEGSELPNGSGAAIPQPPEEKKGKKKRRLK